MCAEQGAAGAGSGGSRRVVLAIGHCRDHTGEELLVQGWAESHPGKLALAEALLLKQRGEMG